MAGVEMSLDDIIALSKKNKAGGGRSSFPDNKRGNKRSFAYKDLDAPEDNGRRHPKATFTGGNGNIIVRINLSNLAPTVTSADLEELFEEYNIEAATVHYNEHGQSLGTGDVFLRRRDAVRAIQTFNGVALDNEILHMTLVDGSQNLGARVSFTPRPRGGFVQKRGSRNDRSQNTDRSGRRGGAGKAKPKTAEELDAELDAYMKKSAI